MTKAGPDDAAVPSITARTRRRKRTLIALGLVAGVIAIVFRGPLFRGNFAEVDPGRVYRSAQPGAGFETSIREHGLKSVLNLRGGNRFNAFYREECAVTERLGVTFYDLPLSATRRPLRRDLMLAVAVIDQGPYPLLIHCKWGSDRTGMVSALYRMIVQGESPEKAIDAFSVSYGHIPLFGPQKLHEPFHEYATWLKQGNLEHTAPRFRGWIAEHYEAPDAFAGWPRIEAGPRRIAAAGR